MAIVITEAEKRLLQSVNLPPRPQTLLTVSAEAKKAEPDVAVVAAAIAADVSISAAVLQVVNSAAYRRAREIESIQQAVMTLGFKRLFPLVRAVALKSTLTSNQSLDDFWFYNEHVAAASVLVAERVGRTQIKDFAYMLGLFQSAGIPLMLNAFPDYYDLFLQAEHTPWPQILQAEREQFDTSHTTVGAMLAQRWQLPKVIIEVIYFLHDDDSLFSAGELAPLGLDLFAIVRTARAIVDQRLRSEAGSQEWQQVVDGVLSHFHLDDVYLEEAMAEIADDVFA
ncbi:HDOD domain-containing protein [Idiomarina xiamenensis]|uniref:Signal transduction protein n=1 Tax=Idiomarina xiamenensis 10-D-4 TaxID=740709 RepID=K2K8J3_9GAMM|nr:HDOD domain-containing protein [Idiomarina xiamenensis]EKE79254.1 signal transduction protein [Idiomarina xiamenensis 10-D-4]